MIHLAISHKPHLLIMRLFLSRLGAALVPQGASNVTPPWLPRRLGPGYCMLPHCAIASGLGTAAGRFPYTPLALRSAWTGRESAMEPTPAVTRGTTVLVPCGQGLARVAITTPGAAPGKLVLKDAPVRLSHARGTQGTAQLTQHSPVISFALARHGVYPLCHTVASPPGPLRSDRWRSPRQGRRGFPYHGVSNKT